MEAISVNSESNLRSAFRATGIHPLNKDEALKRIPDGLPSPSRDEVYRRVSDTFVKTLEGQRYGDRTTTKRGRTLRVSPGKSIAAPTAQGENSEEEDDQDAESVVSVTRPVRPAQSRRRAAVPAAKKRPPADSAAPSSTAKSPAPPAPKRPSADTAAARLPAKKPRSAAAVNEPEARLEVRGTLDVIVPQIGDWVLIKSKVQQELQHSVGKVMSVDTNHELVCSMLRPAEKKLFFWPGVAVTRSVDYSNVVEVLMAPTKLKKKGAPLCFSFDFGELLLH